MPVSVVKTPAEESKWEAAKKAAEKQGLKHTDPKFWKVVMTIYQNMKGKTKK
jgi:uncharacterized protein YpmB